MYALPPFFGIHFFLFAGEYLPKKVRDIHRWKEEKRVIVFAFWFSWIIIYYSDNKKKLIILTFPHFVFAISFHMFSIFRGNVHSMNGGTHLDLHVVCAFFQLQNCLLPNACHFYVYPVLFLFVYLTSLPLKFRDPSGNATHTELQKEFTSYLGDDQLIKY